MSSQSDIATVLQQRLQDLFAKCIQVADQNGAVTKQGTVTQEVFDAQMSSGGRTTLPLLEMLKGPISVELRFSEVSVNQAGRHYARLSVGRKMSDAGRLDSPTCWTDLENRDDAQWYVGAVGDTRTPIDRTLIASWLHHRGPPPVM